jgi:hypothetical protein
MAPGGPKPVTTTRTVPLTSKPSVSTGSVGGLSSAGTYVPKISSHSPAGGGGTLEATTGERANPSLGLRPLR